MVIWRGAPKRLCPPCASWLIVLGLFIAICSPVDSGPGSNASIGASPMLLFSTVHDIWVSGGSLPAGGKLNLLRKLENAHALDFFIEGQLLCWTDHSLEKIQCASYNGTTAGDKWDSVSSGLNTPYGLAVDWYTSKLYWTDGETARLEVATLDGKYRKVLFWADMDQPRAIAVAPMAGLLFWTDWGEIPKIERAGMNGSPSSRRVIVKDNIFWPNGLTIDYATRLLYWVDAKLQFIDVMDFDGNNRQTVVMAGLPYPFAITLFADKLYWTDWETWGIHSWNMSTSGPVQVVLKPGESPVDIRVWDPRRQPPPPAGGEPQPCRGRHQPCSHLCLLAPEPPGYTCACPTGVSLANGSNSQCLSGPQEQLVLVQQHQLSRLSLDAPDYTAFPLPLRTVTHAISVDYDPQGGFIYWTDKGTKSINRAKLDGSEQATVISGDLRNPDGLAVDSAAGNLYWVDPQADTISASRLNGSSRKVLINEGLHDPRAIALLPSLGLMFWTDWSKSSPKIERAALDGTERRLVVGSKLGWPNGLALDPLTHKLYWGDAHTHKIEECNLDGTERRTLLEDLSHIFGLSLLGDYIYWTDWQTRSLNRVLKSSGSGRETLLEQLPSVMGLRAFRTAQKTLSTACSQDNGGCSHLCFARPTDIVCACPIGLELGKDLRSCVRPSAFLVYARKDNLGRLGIENSNNQAVLPIQEIKDASALSVHVSSGHVYWTDSKLRCISRCLVNGSSPQRVVEWVAGGEGLAVDWQGDNLYWTETAAQRIQVCRLSGDSRRALLWQGLRKPKSIALHPQQGYMYWSEWGSKSIKRAGMDGQGARILLEGVGRATALTVDLQGGGRLLWALLEPPRLEAAALDGSNRHTLMVAAPNTMVNAAAVHHNTLYWANWVTGDIESSDKDTATNRTVMYRGLDMISDMSVFHASRQPEGGACSSMSCQHLCLATPAGATCACPTHYTLNPDNTTCSAPDEFILFSHRWGVGRVVERLPGECPDAWLSLPALRGARALEFDSVRRRVYWADRGGAIRHSPEAGGPSTLLLSAAPGLVDMALDSVGRALFWSCAKTNTINVTRLDRDKEAHSHAPIVGTLLQQVGYAPRHLALHQTRRLLFWSDVGAGAVLRARLDGLERREVAHAPNITALCVDPHSDKLYWANAKQIHTADLDGNHSQVIWQGGAVLSLSVLSGVLYWIGSGSGGERQLMHRPLDKKDAPAHSVLHVPHLTDLLAVYKVSRSSACWSGNGCGGVCLWGGECGCVRGLGARPGEAPCGPPPPCGDHYFTCDNKHLADSTQHKDCIPLAWRCDGQVDCPDSSDESGCTSCPNKHKCGDDVCVERDQVCDGTEQCRDGSDEAGCCHSPNNFQCPGTGVCLPPDRLCDGWEQCADGSDERPEACAQRSPETQTGSPGPAGVVAGTVTALILILIVIWFVAYWRRKANAARRRAATDRAAVPLSPCGPTPGRRSPLSTCPTRLTGSGYGSACGRYPREPLDPPPSPATTAPSTAPSAARRRPYRHYRSINRPPPPTPCSTDVCDESDCGGARLRLEAPPPTPCPPSPPSPSSSGYLEGLPLPPPPSPVPTTYR